MNDRHSNKAWADGLIRRFDPDYRYKWEVFDDTLLRYLKPETVWVDAGCGNNALVRSFGHLVHSAVGVDLLEPADTETPFLRGTIGNLPLPDNHADVVSLRFVVEHLQDVDKEFGDVVRVLKPGGTAIFITTNLWNPTIFLPRLLLPPALKHKLLEKLFRTPSDDIFEAYHRLNTPARIRRGVPGLELVELQCISDLNYARKWLFMLFFGWHLLTKPTPLHDLRSNLVAVYRKTGSQ